jgi:hypothetical protein
MHFFLFNLVPGFEVFYKDSTGNLFYIRGKEFKKKICFRLVDNKKERLFFVTNLSRKL